MPVVSYIQGIQLPTLDQVKHIQMDQKHLKTIVGITAATALLYSTFKMLATPDPFDNNKGNKKIPVPDGAYPYIGHIVTFSLNPLKTTKDWHNRYGPLMHIRMGVQHWLLAGDPYFAHKLFVTNGAASSSRPRNNDILKNLMNGERF